jgi:hypothetical protein
VDDLALTDPYPTHLINPFNTSGGLLPAEWNPFSGSVNRIDLIDTIWQESPSINPSNIASPSTIFSFTMADGFNRVATIDPFTGLNSFHSSVSFGGGLISENRLTDVYLDVQQDRMQKERIGNLLLFSVKLLDHATSDYQTDRDVPMAARTLDSVGFAYKQTRDYQNQPLWYKIWFEIAMNAPKTKKPQIIKTEY